MSVLGPLAGGILIGVSATLALALHGRIAGITGVVANMTKARTFAVPFLLGLLAVGFGVSALLPSAVEPLNVSTAKVLAAGLLVGFGTRLANGCTSGHGVCGVARGSGRSLVATSTFMLAAMLTVYVTRAAQGAP